MDHKKYLKTVLIGSAALLLSVGAVTFIVDPYFHYHKPISGWSYPLGTQRYQNDGIVKHFDYDAIITGTSMTENFKTTEFDRLWGVHSIKVNFSGGSYKEIDQNIRRALRANPDVKVILRCLDYNKILDLKDMMRADIEYPDYLYDDNPFNDVNYIFNKEVLFGADLDVIKGTIRHRPGTTFDQYANWNSKYHFNKETVLSTYTRPALKDSKRALTEQEITNIRENVQQNILETARAYPETTFYLFISPYSIAWWDTCYRNGEIEHQVSAEKILIEELLKEDNIKLYSFNTNYEVTCDLNNYKDQAHYGEWVNSDILKWIKNGEYELTEENYLQYLEEELEFYSNYDYDAIYMD